MELSIVELSSWHGFGCPPQISCSFCPLPSMLRMGGFIDDRTVLSSLSAWVRSSNWSFDLEASESRGILCQVYVRYADLTPAPFKLDLSTGIMASFVRIACSAARCLARLGRMPKRSGLELSRCPSVWPMHEDTSARTHRYREDSIRKLG